MACQKRFTVGLALALLLVAGGCGGKAPPLIDDISPPDLAITSPAADGSCSATACSGGVVTAASANPFVLSGTVTDASPVTVRVTVRGTSGVVAGPTQATVSGTGWTFPWSIPAGVAGASFTVDVVATDDKSNTVTRSRTVLVDNVLPTAIFSSPQANPLVGAATVSVAGQVSDAGGFGIARAELSTDGAAFAPLALSGVQFSTDLPVPEVDGVSQVVTVRVTDLAGNAGLATVGYLADRVAPALAITSPAADASCAGATCTGAVVNLASGASFAISGTATDPSGLAPVGGLTGRLLDGPAEVAGSAQALAGPGWTYAWSALPADQGKAYTFELAGEDAAGNRRVATRALWVDRVAPTVSLGQAGQRLVARAAALASFSEPMDEASVLAAVTFSPAPPNRSSFGADDGQVFRFRDPAGLATYQTYAMTVGLTAADKAGNPIAAAAGPSRTFLTETAAVTRLPLETDLASFTPALPAIAIDADGRPHVVYQTSSDQTAGTEPRLASWDGRGASYPANVVRRAMSHVGNTWTAGKAMDLAVYANPVEPATLALSPSLKVLVARAINPTGDAWALEYALSTDRQTWVGQAVGAGEPATSLTTVLRDQEACFDDQRSSCFTLLGPPASRLLANANIAPDPAFDMRSYTVNPVAFTSLSGSANAASRSQCAATLDVVSPATTPDVRYWDVGGPSVAAVAPVNVTQVAGRPQLRSGQLLPCSTLPCLLKCVTNTLGSGHVAYTTATILGTRPFITTTNTLAVACNGDPGGAGTWRTSTASLASGLQTSISRLSTANSSSAFVVAAAASTGVTRVFKVANDACTANPAIVEATASIQGKEPAVAVDDAGTVWVATVSTDPLTVGQLFVDRVSFP